MMQRVLSHKTLRQAAAMRSLLVSVAVCEPPGAFFCCLLCQPPPATRQRWVTTSATKAAEHPKQPQQQQQQQQQRPPEEEAHPSSTPHSQAASQPLHDGRTAGAEASSSTSSPTVQGEPEEVDPLQDKSIGLFQRFKKTFKQYGKVMIPVHLVTSSVWFASFYYAAMKGVNVVPFLEVIGLPESIVGLLRDSSSGYALTAYAMYKIATPARYTVTLGGTSLSVQYLRKHGYFSTPPPVKDYFQDKMEETREMLTEKMEETKERFSEKMEETKGLLSGRREGTKEPLSEKMEQTKDKFSKKLQETKDKVSETSTFRKKNDQ